MKTSKIRTAVLAAVTLLGAFHLSSAQAAEASRAAMPASDSCDDYARGYAAGFCAAMGHSDWESVTYSCNNGRAVIENVTCID